MGIETSTDHGGAGCSFTSAIIAIEELAKVDPSVSVMCDVHNTLVNTVLRKYATKEQQDKWLPELATSKVSIHTPTYLKGPQLFKLFVLARLLLPVRTCLRVGRIRTPNPRQEGRRLLDIERL